MLVYLESFHVCPVYSVSRGMQSLGYVSPHTPFDYSVSGLRLYMGMISSAVQHKSPITGGVILEAHHKK